jgi:hypothetical protein
MRFLFLLIITNQILFISCVNQKSMLVNPSPNPKILLVLCLFSTVLLCTASQQLFIDYGIGTELPTLLSDIRDSFYVEIGEQR